MKSALFSKARRFVGDRTWRRWCAVGLALTAGWTVQAQNGDPGDVTNAVLEAASAILSNVVTQLPDFANTNEVGSTDVTQSDQGSSDTNLLPFVTNGVPSGPPESRRQWLLRQRAGVPNTNEGGQSGATARIRTNSPTVYRPAKPEYSAFKLITERNVFDPNRVRHGPGIQARPKTVDSLTLVGVMSYEKGTFAFFDGTSSEYRKALKETDTIAGFKLAKIGDNEVRLSSGTNQVDLRVGMQLRREEGGDWAPSTQPETYTAAATSSASTTTTTATAGASSSDNDILERLRKKREQE